MKETISSLLILVLTVTQACWAGGRDIYALRPVAFGEKNEIESTIVQGVVDSSGKVDLNQNNFNSLEQELGARFLSLSPGVIKNIIAQRKSNVLFREPPDLIQIKGIGQATLESIQGQLRFLNEPLRCPVRIILSRHIDNNDADEAVAMAKEELGQIELDRTLVVWIEHAHCSVFPDNITEAAKKFDDLHRRTDDSIPRDWKKAILIGAEDSDEVGQLRDFYAFMQRKEIERWKPAGKASAELLKPDDLLSSLDSGDFMFPILEFINQEKTRRRVSVKFETSPFEVWRAFARADFWMKTGLHTVLYKRKEGDEDLAVQTFTRGADYFYLANSLRDQTLAGHILQDLRSNPCAVHLIFRGSFHGKFLSGFLEGKAGTGTKGKKDWYVKSGPGMAYSLAKPSANEKGPRHLILTDFITAMLDFLFIDAKKEPGPEDEDAMTRIDNALQPHQLENWFSELKKCPHLYPVMRSQFTFEWLSAQANIHPFVKRLKLSLSGADAKSAQADLLAQQV